MRNNFLNSNVFLFNAKEEDNHHPIPELKDKQRVFDRF